MEPRLKLFQRVWTEPGRQMDFGIFSAENLAFRDFETVFLWA